MASKCEERSARYKRTKASAQRARTERNMRRDWGRHVKANPNDKQALNNGPRCGK